MATAPAIKIKSLDKNFGSKKALSNVSLSVNKGEVFGFLGPNGAGKTTAIRCLMDYIRPSSGSISILGKDSQRFSPQLKKSIGYLSADTQLHQHWTGKKHLNFLLAAHDKQDQTQSLVSRLGLDMHTRVKNLSSGNKQKLSIVLALCNQPELLIMDEPTRGLDPMLQIELYGIINEHKKAGGTVFLSSHNLPEVQRICDRVAVIKEGKLIETASMSDLLHMQTHIVYASTKKRVDTGDLAKLGVEVIRQNRNEIHMKVRGKLGEVLNELVKYGIKDIDVSHANLEDIFMELYQ
jgi:ABC-2 type transport system ATP-binding protein